MTNLAHVEKSFIYIFIIHELMSIPVPCDFVLAFAQDYDTNFR